MPFDPCQLLVEPRPCPACSEVELRHARVEPFLRSLCGIVDATSARCDVFAILEWGEPYRYVQFVADRDGALQVEASSNEATLGLDGSAALTMYEEAELLDLRYTPPSTYSPNWHRVFLDLWPWNAPLVAELVLRTLVDVFDVSLTDITITLSHAKPGITSSRAVRDADGHPVVHAPLRN